MRLTPLACALRRNGALKSGVQAQRASLPHNHGRCHTSLVRTTTTDARWPYSLLSGYGEPGSVVQGPVHAMPLDIDGMSHETISVSKHFGNPHNDIEVASFGSTPDVLLFKLIAELGLRTCTTCGRSLPSTVERCSSGCFSPTSETLIHPIPQWPVDRPHVILPFRNA